MLYSLSLIIKALFLIVLIMGFMAAYSAYKNQPTWGIVRRMGVPAAVFVWIQLLFFMALFEGGFSIVSYIADFPVWVDLLLFLLIIILAVSIFLYLHLKRDTFNPKMFLLSVFIPLSLPGSSLIAKLSNVGLIEVSNKFGLYFFKATDDAGDVLSVVRKKTFPQIKKTVIGSVTFQTSHEKGTLGDRLTALRLTGMQYKKLPSKIDNIHGIDAVYAKFDSNDKILELLLVENKVDSAKLNKGQMTDEWLLKNADNMMLHTDSDVKYTGYLIRDSIINNNQIVKRQLWNHNLETGVTKITILDANAKPVGKSNEFSDNLISNELKKACEIGRFECQK